MTCIRSLPTGEFVMISYYFRSDLKDLSTSIKLQQPCNSLPEDGMGGYPTDFNVSYLNSEQIYNLLL